jgi:hypothetical protein
MLRFVYVVICVLPLFALFFSSALFKIKETKCEISLYGLLFLFQSPFFMACATFVNLFVNEGCLSFNLKINVHSRRFLVPAICCIKLGIVLSIISGNLIIIFTLVLKLINNETWQSKIQKKGKKLLPSILSDRTI